MAAFQVLKDHLLILLLPVKLLEKEKSKNQINFHFLLLL
jgi:hypothetical protein